MKKNKISKSTILVLKVLLVLIIVLYFAVSIYNITNQNNIANYQFQVQVFNKNPSFGLGIERIESKKQKNDNLFIDYFKPKYTFLIKTSDKLGGYKIEFKRGIFNELEIEKLESFTLDSLKNFDEVINQINRNEFNVTVKKEKTGKVKYEGEKHTKSYRQIGGFDPVEEYFDGLYGLESNRKLSGWKIFDYKLLNQNISPMIYNEKLNLKIDAILGSKLEKFYDQPEAISLLEDPEYPNCIYFIMHFDKGFGAENPRKDSYLKALRVVKKDRSYVEIPPKADGTFDFDSIKDKLK